MTAITIIITDKAEAFEKVEIRMGNVVLKVAGELEAHGKEYLLWYSVGKIDKNKIKEMLGNHVKSVEFVKIDILTETQQLQKEFWEGLKDYMDEEGTFLRPRKPQPDCWYAFAIGRSGFKISLTARIRPKKVGCELYISERGSDALKALKKEKMEIKKKCGELEWHKLKGKRAKIVQYKKWNIKDKEKWMKIYPWLKERAEAFHKVFSPKVKKLRF